MELMLLTEDQKKLVERTPYRYTDHDVLELSCLASQIQSITHVMILFHLAKDEGRAEDQGRELPIFEVLNLLIKPIEEFLNEGAPMQEKDKA